VRFALTIAAITAGLFAGEPSGRAEDQESTSEAVAAEPPVDLAAGCAPGSRRSCPCPNGSWSTQACDPSGSFSFCACGTAGVDVSGFELPNVDFSRPKPPPRRKKSSGLGMLIGGLVTLGLGTTSLAIGITLIREDTVVPLGVVLTATGGTAMLVGLPLSIVGVVNVANGDDRGYHNGAAPPSVPTWSAGPGGLRIAF
jgi:hypothetical protein